MKKQIFLSPPDMGDREIHFVQDAFRTNWIAPVGPNVNAFEREFCDKVGCGYATAVSSGTAALHLALRQSGVQSGDRVLCSTLTFVASVNPVIYQDAEPVFIDSDSRSWNMDPNLLEEALRKSAADNCLPKAVILVHLYGQSADLDPIVALCEHYEVALIEDAAESLGATYKGKMTGTFGTFGAFSFNGNKIITTSGGGMLVSDNEDLVREAYRLACQAKEPAPHYEHSTFGYNYRMSNVLAGIGRGQLLTLEQKILQRRAHFDFYQRELGQLPGVHFMPELPSGRSTRWLSCGTIDPRKAGLDRNTLIARMAEEQIECRPVWKPMHLQPLFSGRKCWGGKVAQTLFEHGFCLPSGSNLSEEDRQRVVETFKGCFSSNSYSKE